MPATVYAMANGTAHSKLGYMVSLLSSWTQGVNLIQSAATSSPGLVAVAACSLFTWLLVAAETGMGSECGPFWIGLSQLSANRCYFCVFAGLCAGLAAVACNMSAESLRVKSGAVFSPARVCVMGRLKRVACLMSHCLALCRTRFNVVKLSTLPASTSKVA